MISNCLYCKHEINYSPSNRTGKYCNNKCQQRHKFEIETRPRIEAGEVKQTLTLRRYLEIIRGYQCEYCSNNGTHNDKSLTLQVDHIDGNSDNNIPKNIRLLCPNCHSQTETWVSRNKKSSRRNKYLQKYKNG
jgi:5-methylcytosine-specific restriction endonuclease McrA